MIRRFLGGVALLPLAGGSALGGTVVYTDLDLFRAAAGDVRVIDFETLPDGNPSQSGVLITPEFNYTAQGVEFAAQAPRLVISGNAESGFNLRAGPLLSSDPTRNWIIADILEPAIAVGVTYPGTAILAIHGTQGEFLGSWIFGGSGDRFLGVVSDIPISMSTIDRGGNSKTIHEFYYAPVPEPASVLLLLAGGAYFCLRGRRKFRHKNVVAAFAFTAFAFQVDSSFAQTWTSTADFNQGTFINLHPTGDQLNINNWTQTATAEPPVLPYLWVACSKRHTVMRIATAQHFSAIHDRIVVTGEILGEYYTAPDNCRQITDHLGPSRTTVDFDGSLWVANRNNITQNTIQVCGQAGACGHIAKIGDGLGSYLRTPFFRAWRGR